MTTHSVAHVLMCGDAGYFQHIAGCLVSLLEHSQDISFSVVVLVTKYSAEAEAKLRRSLNSYANLELRVEEFNGKALQNLPLKNNYPPEIYARFWIEDYFGPDVDRVIYLDGDMVVVDSVKPLLQLDLNENLLAAVPIPGSVRSSILGYPDRYGYFNSGVMVINLPLWRAIDARTLLLQTAHEIVDKLNDPDQDVLNFCFHDRYVPLDFSWNAITPFFRKVNSLPLTKAEIARVADAPKIVHFNGSSKPWDFMCLHPYASVYLRSVAKTEWRGFQPRNKTALNLVKKAVIRSIGEKNSQFISRCLGRIGS